MELGGTSFRGQKRDNDTGGNFQCNEALLLVAVLPLLLLGYFLLVSYCCCFCVDFELVLFTHEQVYMNTQRHGRVKFYFYFLWK